RVGRTVREPGAPCPGRGRPRDRGGQPVMSLHPRRPAWFRSFRLLSILSLGLILPGAPFVAAAAPAGEAQPLYDLILRGGRIVDGTGDPWFEGDVAVRGDRIAS